MASHLPATGLERAGLVCNRSIEWIGCWTSEQQAQRVDRELDLFVTGSGTACGQQVQDSNPISRSLMLL